MVFAGRILDGRFTVKMHSFAPDAFGSPHAPALGAVDGDGVRFEWTSAPHALLEARDLSPRVAIVPLILGDDGSILDAIRTRFDGVGVYYSGFYENLGRIDADGTDLVLRWEAGKATPSLEGLEVYGPRLPETEGPIVMSAYYNDRLVYSTALKNRGEKEVLEFELPRVQLRARNNLKVLAQRDEIGADCGRIQANYPL